MGFHVTCFLCKCHKFRFCHLVALFFPNILTMTFVFKPSREFRELCSEHPHTHTYHPHSTTISIFPYLLSHTFVLTVHQSIVFVCLLLMHLKVMLQPSGLVSDISHKAWPRSNSSSHFQLTRSLQSPGPSVKLHPAALLQTRINASPPGPSSLALS